MFLTPEFSKYGPRHDYTGAHVLDVGGRLAEVVRVYRRDFPPAVMATLRRFNGEYAGEHALAALRVLRRED